jgi:electron transfer flavoprotein alpha subunit
MTTALVYIEARHGAISGSSFELLDGARRLVGPDGTVEGLLASSQPEPLVGQLGACDRVLTISHPALETYLPDAHRDCLVEAVRQRSPDIVLLSYSTVGLDLAAPAAYATARPLVSYCTAASLADGALSVRSQLYGGKLFAEVEAPLPAVLAVNPGAFDEAAGRRDGAPAVEALTAPASLDGLKMRVKEEIRPEAGGVDLTQADKILCVGRGIGDADSIDEAREVAALLGAEIAGSRPVIDNGWLLKAHQVGKSGMKVKPKLYFCLGVSGAPEHLEGMRDAELIIAVNSDAAAPIFEVAHYGAVCDLFDMLPALKERLEGAG